MGLINETNAQYYAGQQAFTNSVSTGPYTWTGDTNLTLSPNPNFKVLKNNVELTLTTDYTVSGNSITLVVAPVLTDVIVIQLLEQSIWDNYGSYAYVSLTDIVNNFMVAYVGLDKIIPRAKRSDVIFHAKRGLQEFSYDTLKSVKSQELTIPPSLSLAIPQDYVNYVQLSWVDSSGVKHIIYPTTLTSNPTQPLLQNVNGTPEQDANGENLESQQAITDNRWKSNNNLNITGQLTDEIFDQANVYNWEWWKMAYGQRYGLIPEISQRNGWFSINERTGTFSFSSNLVNKVIELKYISDGLAYDLNSLVPKFVEDALYSKIMYNICASRRDVDGGTKQFYKRDAYVKTRNAKIRLSNLKLDELSQVLRGQSKWIKH